MSVRQSVVMLGLLAFLSSAAANEKSVAQLERDFSERMSGTVLIGSFTVDGQDPGTAPKEERYEIRSVEKSTGNIWVFTARIKYLNFDTTLPIPVPVVWAGDTPVVSLTDARIPGLGEGFSCRVLFDGNRYAGTWQHGTHGGHMFGRIEKQKLQDEKAADAEADSPSDQ